MAARPGQPEYFGRDADSLISYLVVYRSSPEGGNEIAIWSYASNWLPADSNVLGRLAAGGEIKVAPRLTSPCSIGPRNFLWIEVEFL